MAINNILMDYLHYLKVERGLSENTINSYGIDLKLFLEYLRENEIPSFPFKSDFLFLGHFKLSVLKFSTFLAFGWNYRYILCEITVMCCTASTSVGRKATFLNKKFIPPDRPQKKMYNTAILPEGRKCKERRRIAV